jgi:hypothetical protein
LGRGDPDEALQRVHDGGEDGDVMLRRAGESEERVEEWTEELIGIAVEGFAGSVWQLRWEVETGISQLHMER